MKRFSFDESSSLEHSLPRLPQAETILTETRQLLTRQSEALQSLASRLDDNFPVAVKTIFARNGRLVVCGMGKSGLIGRKIAATFSSTGTPAFFLHASEALHGDLGMVTAQDTLLMISNSGETEEVVKILTAVHDSGVAVIAMAGNANSTLARKANVFLNIGVEREACPLNLAPTTSTLVTLALGDALAMALSQARGFQPRDFARCHPAGSLGRRLCAKVSDVMNTENLPFVTPDDEMSQVVVRMTEGRCGTAIVVQEGRLCGVITDGDLRRGFQRFSDCMERKARDLMSSNPVVVSEDASVGDAEELMRTKRIKALLAVDAREKITGVIEIYAK